MSEDTSSDYNYEQFDEVNADNSLVYPMLCSALRVNGYIVIQNHPCKIVELSTCQPGKHGHAKVVLVGLDIFTGKKLSFSASTHHQVPVPFVKTEEYTLIDIEDGYLSLLTKEGSTKDDIKVPEGKLGKKFSTIDISEYDITVSVISAMNQEMCTGWRIN